MKDLLVMCLDDNPQLTLKHLALISHLAAVSMPVAQAAMSLR